MNRRWMIPVFTLCVLLASCEQVNCDENEIQSPPVICISDNKTSVILSNLEKRDHSYVEQDNDVNCLFVATHGFYSLPEYYSTPEIVNIFALGHSSVEKDILRTGDIGDIKSVYKNLDFNGDAVTDKIIRKASKVEEMLTVDYRISVTNGIFVDIPTISDYVDFYAGGGEVFEFYDLNDDKNQEILFTRYIYTPEGYKVKKAVLYYIYDNKWENFDFTARLEGVIGIQLIEDGHIIVLVDSGDKCNSFLDTFLFKMDGKEIYCSENSPEYVKTYWPIDYGAFYTYEMCGGVL